MGAFWSGAEFLGSHLTIIQLPGNLGALRWGPGRDLYGLGDRGDWYHVSDRGKEWKAMYRDHRDQRHVLEIIVKMVARYRVRFHGFVLMDHHSHLLLELSETNLSWAAQWLNTWELNNRGFEALYNELP
jgi:hypothetical protein